MKTHIAAIAKDNEIIAAADAKVARCIGDRTKYHAAHEAAGKTAETLQEKAARAAALAAVGEGDEASARKLEADSIAATARVASIALALRGFDDAESTSAGIAAEARAHRAAETLAALDVHIESVAGEYLTAAQAFIKANRRVHALSRIRNTLTGRHAETLFASNSDAQSLVIPAMNSPRFDGLRSGVGGSVIYNAGSELHSAHAESARMDAEVIEVIAMLSKAGLDI